MTRKGNDNMNENMKEEKAKVYELRSLTADDMFPMFQIISKVGVKDFKTCFESPAVMDAIASAISGGGEKDLAAVGMTVAFDVAGIVIARLPDCKDDIYLLLSQLSGMSREEIAKLPMRTFLEMIMDVIRKPEFTDFFQDVSKLFK